MRKTLLFLVLLSVFISGVHPACQPTYKPLDSNDKIHFRSGLVLYSLVLFSSFRFDENIREDFTQFHGNFQDKYFDLLNYGGEAKYSAFMPLLLYGVGLAVKNEKLKRTSCIAFESFVVSGVMTSVLKYSLGRARPYNEKGTLYFTPFPQGFDNDYFSLPSGHSSTAWSIVTPYAEEYSKWLYIIPVSVSLARIYKDQHWFSDVLLGGGLGYFTSWYMVHRPSKKFRLSGNSLVIYF